MTIIEIAKTFNLQPKDVAAFVQQNATFPVKKNFQTGEITIPDNIDIKSFLAPLIEGIQNEQKEKAKREAEKIAQQHKHQTELRLMQEDLKQQQAEQLHTVAIEKLKSNGAEGYWQYKVLSLVDKDGGYLDATQLTDNLNALGIEGWHLVAAYSNELGHNTNPSAFGASTNATIDQNILIFERFVKFR